MTPFIQNHQLNQIRHEMAQISSVLKYNSDPMIIEGSKEIAQDKIDALFESLSGEEKNLIQMAFVKSPQEVKDYLDGLESYTYGMNPLTEGQIKKIFSKEKKLKLPEKFIREAMYSYLGWLDEGKKKIYLAYELDQKLVGIVGQINPSNRKNIAMCTLCGFMHDGQEVVNVTVQLKKKGPDHYHTIGFNICKDGSACNSRIQDLSRLENLLKKIHQK